MWPAEADDMTAPAIPRAAQRPSRLILVTASAAGLGLAGWITALALVLPARYEANHWNVAWAGFDAMLLVSLAVSGWAIVRRPARAESAMTASAVLLLCDAWFDITTAAGTGDTAVAVAVAVLVELPAAAVLTVAARRARTRPDPGRSVVQRQGDVAGGGSGRVDDDRVRAGLLDRDPVGAAGVLPHAARPDRGARRVEHPDR
jgi:hypothetical protein